MAQEIQLVPAYNYLALSLAVVVAILSSYMTVTLIARLQGTYGRGRFAWTIGAALSMGTGVWSMHFMGMLAIVLPVPVHFNLADTVTTLVVSVVGFFLTVLLIGTKRDRVGVPTLIAAGTLAAATVIATHFTGISAIRTQLMLHHRPPLYLAAFVLGVLGACLSLYIAFGMACTSLASLMRRRVIGGMLLGLTVAAMHFTALAAARFSVVPDLAWSVDGILERRFVIVGVGFSTVLLLALVQLAWHLDQQAFRSITGTLEAINDAFLAMDNHWRVTYVNARFEQLIRVRREQVLGKMLWDALPERRDSPFHRQYKRAMAEQKALSFTEHYEPLDLWFSVNAHPSPDGISIYFRDVTSEIRYRHLQEHLVANASHELRGPLASISVMIEALHDNVVPTQEHSRYTKAMLTEVNRLRRLTDDLLELSRLDAGVALFIREEFNLGPLFEEIQEAWTPRYATSGLLLLVDVPSIRVLANYDRVHQVLANLLENALKYTPTGGSVRVHGMITGSFVKVSVTDTGIGITREHQPFVWDRFYKEDSARTRKPANGAGLGLSLVRQIVNQMGGEVSLESERFRGSVFSFTLPLASETMQREMGAS